MCRSWKSLNPIDFDIMHGVQWPISLVSTGRVSPNWICTMSIIVKVTYPDTSQQPKCFGIRMNVIIHGVALQERLTGNPVRKWQLRQIIEHRRPVGSTYTYMHSQKCNDYERHGMWLLFLALIDRAWASIWLPNFKKSYGELRRGETERRIPTLNHGTFDSTIRRSTERPRASHSQQDNSRRHQCGFAAQTPPLGNENRGQNGGAPSGRPHRLPPRRRASSRSKPPEGSDSSPF